jgi:hypothetical protein
MSLIHFFYCKKSRSLCTFQKVINYFFEHVKTKILAPLAKSKTESFSLAIAAHYLTTYNVLRKNTI